MEYQQSKKRGVSVTIQAFEYSLYMVCYKSEKDEKMSKLWLLLDFLVSFPKGMGEIRRDLGSS